MKPDGIYLIGLTGNIACGKSSVVAMLKKLGAHAIDADKVVHRLQEPGNSIYQQIVESFGAEIVTHAGGPIDRAKLGTIVFHDPHAMQTLEQIIHPTVHGEIVTWLKQLALTTTERQVAIVDAIKLLETGWRDHCDAIWVVSCQKEQQLDRLIQTRGMTEKDARQRIEAQPAQAEKIAQADVVIDNSGTLEQTHAQVEHAWQHIQHELSEI